MAYTIVNLPLDNQPTLFKVTYRLQKQLQENKHNQQYFSKASSNPDERLTITQENNQLIYEQLAQAQKENQKLKDELQSYKDIKELRDLKQLKDQIQMLTMSNNRLQKQLKEIFSKQKLIMEENQQLYDSGLKTRIELEDLKFKKVSIEKSLNQQLKRKEEEITRLKQERYLQNGASPKNSIGQQFNSSLQQFFSKRQQSPSPNKVYTASINFFNKL